jgi:hypothetical protein
MTEPWRLLAFLDGLEVRAKALIRPMTACDAFNFPGAVSTFHVWRLRPRPPAALGTRSSSEVPAVFRHGRHCPATLAPPPSHVMERT